MLQWYFNNSVPLKTGKKYDVQEKKTDTKCKKDFILTIVNVTDADAGKYSCHSICSIQQVNTAIELKVFHEQTTGRNIFYDILADFVNWLLIDYYTGWLSYLVSN